MLQVNDKHLETTASGFLLDATQWDESVAGTLAQQAGIRLEAAHWEVIYHLRAYYDQFNHLPNARMFVKLMQKCMGDEKGNSVYLHRLFPESAVRTACLIAGLPKPPGCI
ncbi:TusE/DsrC/DsvC family sulfur relay protein [Candidatus Methylospira mobilis]|uniref:Sulfurtransferase n=1 Tax=Candidatus Methylospira mobilis TaxID=1808979 RepID=A0A5Q0BMF2_9GAMM|nr:TusE/DsrC/DsvC family sulfur relay protein [Candidatus Methylospira mobilis]QFY43298.1 TusE/DsrC/DsvC family sulfur relay protein [Candidatus Methylospira mobilis]